MNRPLGSWVKRGVVLAAPPPLRFARSHAALPTVNGDWLYFSTRDASGRSWIARARISFARDGVKVGELDPDPVLGPGALGAFDDAGVSVSCVVEHGGERWLYYTGWSLAVSVPFYLAIGLAVSRDGSAFGRVSEAPVLGRTRHDPYLTASPHVLRTAAGWRMWYVSGVRWSQTEHGPRHHYHMRHATSVDGIEWDADGTVCLDFADPREYAFSRPCVLRGDAGYEMWFAVRGDAYRLGYARSADGLHWERDDAGAGVRPSEHGWDSEMIAYPHVVEVDGTRVMLYNGNGYGVTGIGAACAVRR